MPYTSPNGWSTRYIKITCNLWDITIVKGLYYSYPSVETLKVKKGPGLLWSLPLELFPKLKRVEMLDCEHLQSLSILEQSCQSLTSLTCLEIKNCRNFVSFPRSGLCAPNLRKIEVSDCQKLKSLPDSMHTLLPSLMALILIRCPELESVAGCSFPSNCDNFFPSYMQWSLQSRHSLKEFIIAYRGNKVDSFPSKASLPPSLIRFSILTFQNVKLRMVRDFNTSPRSKNCRLFGVRILRAYQKRACKIHFPSYIY